MEKWYGSTATPSNAGRAAREQREVADGRADGIETIFNRNVEAKEEREAAEQVRRLCL